MAMTMNLGLGLEAELNYRKERLRADFRRSHGTNKPRWWQRRPPAAVGAHRTTTEVGTQPAGGDTVNAKTVAVVPVAMESLVVGSRAGTANSPKDRAHAA
jgi:hypothetical protein